MYVFAACSPSLGTWFPFLAHKRLMTGGGLPGTALFPHNAGAASPGALCPTSPAFTDNPNPPLLLSYLQRTRNSESGVHGPTGFIWVTNGLLESSGRHSA